MEKCWRWRIAPSGRREDTPAPARPSLRGSRGDPGWRLTARVPPCSRSMQRACTERASVSRAVARRGAPPLPPMSLAACRCWRREHDGAVRGSRAPAIGWRRATGPGGRGTGRGWPSWCLATALPRPRQSDAGSEGSRVLLPQHRQHMKCSDGECALPEPLAMFCARTFPLTFPLALLP